MQDALLEDLQRIREGKITVSIRWKLLDIEEGEDDATVLADADAVKVRSTTQRSNVTSFT